MDSRIVSCALHSRATYGPKGLRPLHFSQREDLYTIIRRMESFVVDTHIAWKPLSLRHPGKAFILGPTFLREQGNLDGALFNAEVREGRENVFILSRMNDHLCIERLDAYFRAGFKRKLPRQKEFTEKELRNWNDPGLRASLLSEIPRFQASPKLVSSFISKNFKKCAGNIGLSGRVAAYCHAKLLLELRPSHRELSKLQRNDQNCLGDSELIMTALFFGSSILSEDILLKEMASFCSVPVRPEPLAYTSKACIASKK